MEARFEGGQGPEGAVVPYMEMEWNGCINTIRSPDEEHCDARNM